MPLIESRLTVPSPRLATRAWSPFDDMSRPEGCFPTASEVTSFGGVALRSMTWILLSSTCFRASPSLITSTESDTSASEPSGVIARFTGGPMIEFFRGRLATILGASGSARSTMTTLSRPGAERTPLPSSSQMSFSSFPTIRYGAAYAEVASDAAAERVSNPNPSRIW